MVVIIQLIFIPESGQRFGINIQTGKIQPKPLLIRFSDGAKALLPLLVNEF